MATSTKKRSEPGSGEDRDGKKSDAKELLMDRVRATIKKLDKAARDLTRLARENINTKREIKVDLRDHQKP